MSNASRFQDAIARYVVDGAAGFGVALEARKEMTVGLRFVNNLRKLDLVFRHGTRFVGVEAKLQQSSGTAYQKLGYALQDAKVTPIPTIIVFAGQGIRDDMKAALVTSGVGIEVGFEAGLSPELDRIVDRDRVLLQRVFIELGLDWFQLYS